jgi:uncharacterized protein (TIGR00369 family)
MEKLLTKSMDLIRIYEKTNTFGNEMGMELTVFSPGHISYALTITEKHLAVPKVAHGGVVAALIDGALGVAGLSLAAEENKVVSTVEFKVNYLQPARVGDELTCEAKVIHAGKRLLNIEAKVTNQQNALIATSSGTFNKYPAEQSTLEIS